VPLYQKVDGVWVLCQRPYVKRNGVWTPADEAWIKSGGAWVQAYDFDVTPPNPPQIDLSVFEDYDTIKGVKTLVTRYIKVGVRLPGGANDPEARLVRVLTDYAGKPPTTQYGGTFTSAPDDNYANEPWSEWRYNEFGAHADTSVTNYKQWPRNATAGSVVGSDQTYNFTGWSLDAAGNWSAATPASIHIPKAGIAAANVITHEARFQPNASGSWRNTGFQSGNLVQQKSPRSQGLWFYGNQFTDSINGQVTIKNSQIRIVRAADDGGSATANIYLFWTDYGSTGALPATGTAITRHNITKIGQLSKGEADWFDLPAAFNDDLATNIKGMGLDWKDPAKADAFPADFSSVVSTASAIRCGEVHVVWEEQL
jgi:hypothetical protein